MTLQLWNHKISGESYAVEFDNGNVTEANGPLHYSEIPEVMASGFVPNPDPDTAEWINENQEEFYLAQVR